MAGSGNTAAEKIEDIIHRYVSILKSLKEEEGLTGQTGDKLTEFAETAEFLLEGIMKDTTKLLTGQMEEYLWETDQADEEIY